MEPAIELRKLRWAVGKISPIMRNGMHPNPIEKPIIKTMRLDTGKYLEFKEYY